MAGTTKVSAWPALLGASSVSSAARRTILQGKKATGDCDLKHVTPTKSSVISYDGGNVPVLRTVKLQVLRGSFICPLLSPLEESKRCRPILGKSACERMGVVEIKDSDAIQRPHRRVVVKLFLSRM